MASTSIVPFGDLFLLIYPITFSLKPFLQKKGHTSDEVEKMHAAWVKSCLLQVTLWSQPYVKDKEFYFRQPVSARRFVKPAAMTRRAPRPR
ncbi:protoglobin domain-containing protein [Cupriavidus sp. CP313]